MKTDLILMSTLIDGDIGELILTRGDQSDTTLRNFLRTRWKIRMDVGQRRRRDSPEIRC